MYTLKQKTIALAAFLVMYATLAAVCFYIASGGPIFIATSGAILLVSSPNFLSDLKLLCKIWERNNG